VGLVSLVGFIHLVDFIGVVGLVGLVELNGLGLVDSSTYHCFCNYLAATAITTATLFAVSRNQACRVAKLFATALRDHLVAAAVKTTLWLKHTASHGVAALCISASKIVNATTVNYATSLLHVGLFVREKMMCWWLELSKKKMWCWIASFGKSYLGDVLQYSNQLFFHSLPEMTKYCIMRECENIYSWISPSVDLAFSHKQEFTVLNSPKGFWRSLPEISLLSFTLLLN
jgi:hypothetical protein